MHDANDAVDWSSSSSSSAPPPPAEVAGLSSVPSSGLDGMCKVAHCAGVYEVAHGGEVCEVELLSRQSCWSGGGGLCQEVSRVITLKK